MAMAIPVNANISKFGEFWPPTLRENMVQSEFSKESPTQFLWPFNVETREHKEYTECLEPEVMHLKKKTFCQTIHSCELRSLCFPCFFFGGGCPTCPSCIWVSLLFTCIRPTSGWWKTRNPRCTVRFKKRSREWCWIASQNRVYTHTHMQMICIQICITLALLGSLTWFWAVDLQTIEVS